MEPQEILDKTRKAISEHAGNDRDKWFYANRFVFARLQLDERKTKNHIKKELKKANKPCRYCGKPFEKKTGVHLHRLDEGCGYSLENCALMHGECHKKYHAENPQDISHDRPSKGKEINPATQISKRFSTRYVGRSYIYWWDIAPGFKDKISYYKAVAFIKKDTKERCCIPTSKLRKYLIPKRQTSRGDGNWGIKVLKDREDELAFEPGNKNNEWLFLPVVWLNDTQED